MKIFKNGKEIFKKKKIITFYYLQKMKDFKLLLMKKQQKQINLKIYLDHRNSTVELNQMKYSKKQMSIEDYMLFNEMIKFQEIANQ